MFYQVFVPEKLWWPDGNLDKGLQEFVMTVHLLRSVVTRTATKNETKYGTEAADTLRNNFYVDEKL